MAEQAVRRVLAANPGALTGPGTNTWILGTGRVAVVDPGPALPGHLAAILGALTPGETVSHILVTHAHADHSPLARDLARVTGAPVMGFGPPEAGRRTVMEGLAASGLAGGGEGVDAAFAPDIALADGAVITGGDWRLEALHVPGHFAGHLAFAWTVGKGGDRLFSGDHVMGWATTLVSPPDGDMGAYMASLLRLAGRPWARFYPGHGAPVEDPAARIAELVAHRRGREASILAALAQGAAPLHELTARVYADIAPALLPAAARNALAHLIDLHERGRITASPHLGADAVFALP